MPLKQLIHQHGDAAVSALNRFTNLLIKKTRNDNQLTFLLRCRDNKLVPKGLQLKTSLRRSAPAIAKILHEASSKILKHQISNLRQGRSHLHQAIQNGKSTLKHQLESDIYEKIQNITATSSKSLHDKIRTNHIKKFQDLLNHNVKNRNKTARKNRDDYLNKTVINLSSKPLTTSQISLLSKGLSYVLTNPRPNPDVYISDIEKGLQQLAPNGNVDYLRHQIADIIRKTPSQQNNLSKDERKAIQELRKDKGITITAADKGKATVIMDTPEFIQLVDKTLGDPTTYKPLNKDPTAKLERQLKKTLKTLHTNREISDSIFNHLNPNNSQPPYARATVKRTL
ncbi:uncharacterized protein [Haliotis asinina]|uniref:uncharacterized protein n=1 Tax=Haliotis asinina TaxID=109174 RepID=UPI003531C10B